MTKRLLLMICLAASVTPAWAETTLHFSEVRQPSTTFVVGPGMVVSVDVVDMPFTKPRHVVKFKTDGGQLIEVSQPGGDILLLPGMYGIMTYSTHPEMIRRFRLMRQILPQSQRPDGSSGSTPPSS